MKALILAAGEGRRLQPVTAFVPKCMIPFFGKPFLGYSIENLCNSFSEVGIVVNYLKDKVQDFFGEKFANSSIHYVEQRNLGGTGDAVLAAEPFVGNEEFLLLLGDVFAPKKLVRRISSAPGNVLTATRVADPENHNPILLKGSGVAAIKERSDFVDAGIYKLTPAFMQALKSARNSISRGRPASGELRLMAGFKELLASGQAVGYEALAGPWVQIGDHEGLRGILSAKDFFRRYLGRKADFEESSVDCSAENSKIINSVVFGPGRLEDCRIENSLAYVSRVAEGIRISDAIEAVV